MLRAVILNGPDVDLDDEVDDLIRLVATRWCTGCGRAHLWPAAPNDEDVYVLIETRNVADDLIGYYEHTLTIVDELLDDVQTPA